MSTTARKPPSKPSARPTSRAAAITRKPKPGDDCPLVRAVMQRVRREIAESHGTINFETIAAEIGTSATQVSEWTRLWRAKPGGERFAQFCRWLGRRNPQALREVFEAKTILEVGPIELSGGKLTETEVRKIKASDEDDEALVKRYNVSTDTIRHIHAGRKRANVN